MTQKISTQAAINESSWWSRATEKERRDQVIGGIEVGMTPTQIAMNCGCRLYGDKLSIREQGRVILNFCRTRGIRGLKIVQ